MFELDAFAFSSAEPDAQSKVVKVSDSSTTKADLIREVGVSLGGPEHFGQNWDALDECLRDLSWVTQHSVVIKHTGLPRVPLDVLRTYLEILARGVESWQGSPEHTLTVVFTPNVKEEIARAIRGE